MTDTEKRPSGGDVSNKHPNDDKKENEKKKRTRVKQIMAEVQKQVEFWFGDANLRKDRFLKQLINASRDGYVDVSVLTTFNRMKNLTTDVKLIARALKNSSLLEVNLEGTKVRRKRPIEEIASDVDACTVYVELLPRDVTHSWIERVFSQCGTIVYISIPRYRSTSQPKGFAFVEFETADQAQKAIEMLNNPPEDAPRKVGIFPKTKKGKVLPEAPTEDEEDKKKKKKKKSRSASQPVAMETTESTETSNQREETSGQTEAQSGPVRAQADGGATEPKEAMEGVGDGEAQAKPLGKRGEKKRRRSQSTEAAELSSGQEGAPNKMRKLHEESEGDIKECATASEKQEEAEDKKNDSLLKAKRKHKKKYKERMKIGGEVIPLRVLSKVKWMELKEQYLDLQKRSMAALKKSMTEITPKSDMEWNTAANANKATTTGPQFESGLIVKITHPQPLPGRECVKSTLSEISAVVYVDILAGDVEGHVRFKTAEDAQAVMAAQTQLQKKHNWKLEILSGDHEQRYWQKILVDRQAKLNRSRDKKRGTEKLIAKAEKIIVARAKEASKHILFMDD